MLTDLYCTRWWDRVFQHCISFYVAQLLLCLLTLRQSLGIWSHAWKGETTGGQSSHPGSKDANLIWAHLILLRNEAYRSVLWCWRIDDWERFIQGFPPVLPVLVCILFIKLLVFRLWCDLVHTDGVLVSLCCRNYNQDTDEDNSEEESEEDSEEDEEDEEENDYKAMGHSCEYERLVSEFISCTSSLKVVVLAKLPEWTLSIRSLRMHWPTHLYICAKVNEP